MTHEWPNPAKEENAHGVWWEFYPDEPIYDEEPGEGQDFWPEQEVILAALKGGNSDSPNTLQSKICKSERLKELAKSSNIQDSQQKNVPPGTRNSLTWSSLECGSSKREPLGMNTSPNMDHFSLSNMFMEEHNMAAGNNFNEKFEMKGHLPFVNDNDIYNNLQNLPEISMSAKESVYDLKPVLIIENAPFLEFNDLKKPLCHPSGKLEWTEIGSIYAADTCDLKLRSLRTATSYDLGGLASENNVLIFDPGGYVHNITAVNGIHEVGDGINRVVSEINQHCVDSARAGMKVITKCMVMK